MSDYTPKEATVKVAWSEFLYLQSHGMKHVDDSRAEFNRFIAKVKADAVREWADFQEQTLQTHIQAADPEDMEEVQAWTAAARKYADRIEEEA